jgi:hypothetical protein
MYKKPSPGQEYRSKAIKEAIKRVGDYSEFVTVWSIWKLNDYVFYYKIDNKLPKELIDKIRMSIEIEAGRLNFEVVRHV